MKKIFSAILAVMILLSAVPASALTANESLPLLYYEINDDKVTITGAEFEAESLTIPENIEGYTVTAIADYAFNNRSFLKEIILPETITSIGLYAFAFSSITSINIPGGVTSIPEGAFSDCLYLKDVYYEGTSEGWNNITIDALNDPILNANVLFYWTNYNYVSINGCIETATNVVIPDSITGIPVTSISYNAFANNSVLSSIEIPSTFTSIGIGDFMGCTNLKTVILHEGINTIKQRAFFRCKNLTSITIPKSVETIEADAFTYCNSLTDLIIPEGVTTIGNAFSYCQGLKSVVLPASLTNCGNITMGCQNIEALEISEDNPVYYSEGNCIIEKDTQTLIIGCKTSVIPEGVLTIGSTAFYANDNITEIVIPEGVTSISSSVFSYCAGLTEISLPQSLKEINRGSFYGCDSLTTINYAGTEEQWNNIFIDDINDSLYNANIVFLGENDNEEPESYTDFTLAATSEHKDGKLYVYYDLYNNPGIWSVTVDMSFNADALELAEVINGDVFTATEYVESPVRGGEHRYYAALDSIENRYDNGRLATYVFNIKDTSLEYGISLSVDEENIFDCDAVNKALTVVDLVDDGYEGEVDPPDVSVGDINGDGSINTQDVFRMKLFIKTIVEPTEAERLAADINGDGLINSADTFALSYRILRGEWA